MNITLCPKTVFRKNLYLILVLLCANMLGIIATYCFGHDFVYGLVPLFDFDTEKNVPTLYSSIALIVASVLLALISITYKRVKLSYIPWLGLSVIFLFLAIDEIASIHERLITPIREALGTSGFLYYAWIIPYSIALVIFIIAYAKFLFQLPRNTMILFLVSGSVFISGAIGFEMLGGKYTDLYGTDNIFYAFITTCEELLEMFGIAIFIYTLLVYIVDQFEPITITVANNNH